MHSAHLPDHRTRSASRCLAALVAVELISPQEALGYLLQANGSPPNGSQRRTQLAWLLADDIAHARREQPVPSLGDIVGRIVARAMRQRTEFFGGNYCPLYEPDLLRQPPDPAAPRYQRTARRYWQ